MNIIRTLVVLCATVTAVLAQLVSSMHCTCPVNSSTETAESLGNRKSVQKCFVRLNLGYKLSVKLTFKLPSKSSYHRYLFLRTYMYFLFFNFFSLIVF